MNINWDKVERAAARQANKEDADAKRKLADIDLKSIRALRAIAAGTQTQADINELKALDAEAAALRGKVKK